MSSKRHKTSGSQLITNTLFPEVYHLPDELLIEVFLFVDFKTLLLKLELVGRRFKFLVDVNYIWKFKLLGPNEKHRDVIEFVFGEINEKIQKRHFVHFMSHSMRTFCSMFTLQLGSDLNVRPLILVLEQEFDNSKKTNLKDASSFNMAISLTSFERSQFPVVDFLQRCRIRCVELEAKYQCNLDEDFDSEMKLFNHSRAMILYVDGQRKKQLAKMIADGCDEKEADKICRKQFSIEMIHHCNVVKQSTDKIRKIIDDKMIGDGIIGGLFTEPIRWNVYDHNGIPKQKKQYKGTVKIVLNSIARIIDIWYPVLLKRLKESRSVGVQFCLFLPEC